MHLGAFGPSGAIVSSAEDMAKFALFQLGDGTWNGLPAMLVHYNFDVFDLMLPVLGAAVPAEFIYDDGKVSGLSVMMEPTPGIKPEIFTR